MKLGSRLAITAALGAAALTGSMAAACSSSR